MPTAELPSSGVLQVRVADDLILDGGTWHLAAGQDQHPVAVIEPPVTPMYRQVAAYLEAKPAPPDANPKRDDEARAATAVCLRWGSYFALLADPARPPSPSIDDEQVSQIDDDEMARMNVKISATLAWWFGLCGASERRYWDLVERALAYLPSGPKTVSASQAADTLLACSTAVMAAEVGAGPRGNARSGCLGPRQFPGRKCRGTAGQRRRLQKLSPICICHPQSSSPDVGFRFLSPTGNSVLAVKELPISLHDNMRQLV